MSESSSPVWYEYFDDSSGCLYYYNSLDGSSQWTIPFGRSGEPVAYISATAVEQDVGCTNSADVVVHQDYSDTDDIEAGAYNRCAK